MRRENVDLLVIGAGPSGLTVAAAIARTGRHVLVCEREPVPGGVPRHCNHSGFGVRDLHRLYSGPAYAARLVAEASASGARIETGWMITGWDNEPGREPGSDASLPAALATSRQGRTRIEARAVLLATGCRERPRSARLIPGSRPAGVFTTGTVQQLVHLHHQRVGQVAVIVGAEHIAFSALQTLAASGTRVAAVTTESPVLQTFAALRLATAGIRLIPVMTNTQLSEIHGHHRVEAVTLTNLATGAARQLKCDTVVLTGDWIPDHELARTAGVDIDPVTLGPIVDTGLRTSRPGVFAAGNVIHPAEPADAAALRARSAIRPIEQLLATAHGSARPAVPIVVRSPLAWVTPQATRPGDPPPKDGFALRVSRGAPRGWLVVRQHGRQLHRSWRPWLIPNRRVTLPAGWIRKVNSSAGPVEITYTETR